MQKKFVSFFFPNAAIKKIDTVHSFMHIGIKSVHKKQISADAGSLFHRLLILVNRSADIPSIRWKTLDSGKFDACLTLSVGLEIRRRNA